MPKPSPYPECPLAAAPFRAPRAPASATIVSTLRTCLLLASAPRRGQVSPRPYCQHGGSAPRSTSFLSLLGPAALRQKPAHLCLAVSQTYLARSPLSRRKCWAPVGAAFGSYSRTVFTCSCHGWSWAWASLGCGVFSHYLPAPLGLRPVPMDGGALPNAPCTSLDVCVQLYRPKGIKPPPDLWVCHMFLAPTLESNQTP
jgi:hypothetical protein